uniref:Uncharacterized protein n=1 Tax=Anguilla anguilla TaxID=7936 RepID=A0A0E9WGS3_ANGAN
MLGLTNPKPDTIQIGSFICKGLNVSMAKMSLFTETICTVKSVREVKHCIITPCSAVTFTILYIQETGFAPPTLTS